MSHPLVLALFPDTAGAAAGVRAVREAGIEAEEISVVARSHEEEGVLARQFGGTPGADIEDSWPAARLGEVSAHVLAAIALVLPGIGPLVAAGPLSAGLGEVAGHVAGGIASVLQRAGVREAQAEAWQQDVERGAILIGVHVLRGDAEPIATSLARSGARDVVQAQWT